MKKFARLICIIMAALMLFSFVSCGDSSGNENETTKGTSSSNTEDETNKDLGYVSELPSDLKFSGSTVRMLGLKKSGVDDELYSEKSNTGNNVNDAIYLRNDTIENRLGITFDIELRDKPMDDIENIIKAGGPDAFQIYADGANNTVRSMVKGYFYDLSEVENLDVEKKYWSQGFRDIASYGVEDKQYLITGAPALSLYRYTFVTIFNRDYFTKAGWEDLYQTVNNGDWTLDYQFSLIKDVYTEMDGKNGLSEGDFVGLVSGNTVSIDPYLTASGLHIIQKNKDGRWEFKTDTQERYALMVEKIQNIFYNSNGSYIYSTATYDDTGLTYIADKFAAEEAAMATVQLYALEQTIRSMDFKYGIVPMPKFDTNQENYCSYVQDQVTSFGILTCTDPAKLPMLGATLDLFAYESYKTVVPQYYEVSLSHKFLQDSESKEMLDLIYETTEFDFVGAFSAVLPAVVRDDTRVVIANTRGNVVSSTYRRWTSSLNKTDKNGYTGIDKSFNNMLDEFDH